MAFVDMLHDCSPGESTRQGHISGVDRPLRVDMVHECNPCVLIPRAISMHYNGKGHNALYAPQRANICLLLQDNANSYINIIVIYAAMGMRYVTVMAKIIQK